LKCCYDYGAKKIAFKFSKQKVRKNLTLDGLLFDHVHFILFTLPSLMGYRGYVVRLTLKKMGTIRKILSCHKSAEPVVFSEKCKQNVEM